MDRITTNPTTYAPLRGGNTERIKTTRRSDKFGYVVIAIVVSVLILLAEIVCALLMIISIMHLEQYAKSSEPTPSYDHLSTHPDLLQVPCNQSSPCTLLMGQNSTTTLLKLMLGVRRQAEVRTNQRKKKRNHVHDQTLSVQFTLNSRNNEPLSWTHTLHDKGDESNGTVMIQTTATYGLYNIFTFQSPRHTEQMELIHQINIERLSENYSSDVFLKKSVELSPSIQSYMSHDFFEFVYLHEGDRLYPAVSNTSYIYNARHSSSWGLFQIT